MQRYSITNYPAKILISSALIVLITFFYVFSVGSYFEVEILQFEDRQTIQKSFQNYVYDKFVDSIVILISTIFWFAISIFGKARFLSLIIYGSATLLALIANISPLLELITLISLPVIVTILIYNKFSIKKILKGSSNLTLAIYGIFGLSLGTLSLFMSIFGKLIFPQTFTDYAFQIFILISAISPILIFLLVLGFPIKLFLVKTIRKLKFNSNLSHQKLTSKVKIFYLILFIVLSVIIVQIPHHSGINNENELVGADSLDYAKWINELKKLDTEKIIHQAFFVQPYSDRPLSLLLLFPVVDTFGDTPEQTIDNLPIILSPILVLVVFFLTRELTSNDITSLLASFLSAISFHALIGSYSGLYSNWMALIFGYLAFVFLIKFLKIPTKKNYFIFSSLLFLMLFTHVYTWTILIFFMIMFLGVSYKLKFFKIKHIILIGLILTSSIVVDITKSIFSDSIGGIEGDIAIASTMVSINNTSIIWDNFIQSVHVFAGGQLSNILILLLCIYWILRSDPRLSQNIFIGIFFSIAILPILFGNYVIQTRVLYDIPFQIPAAIALTYFFNRSYGKMIVVSICIAILAMAVKSVTNFL